MTFKLDQYFAPTQLLKGLIKNLKAFGKDSEKLVRLLDNLNKSGQAVDSETLEQTILSLIGSEAISLQKIMDELVKVQMALIDQEILHQLGEMTLDRLGQFKETHKGVLNCISELTVDFSIESLKKQKEQFKNEPNLSAILEQAEQALQALQDETNQLMKENRHFVLAKPILSKEKDEEEHKSAPIEIQNLAKKLRKDIRFSHILIKKGVKNEFDDGGIQIYFKNEADLKAFIRENKIDTEKNIVNGMCYLTGALLDTFLKKHNEKSPEVEFLNYLIDNSNPNELAGAFAVKKLRANNIISLIEGQIKESNFDEDVINKSMSLLAALLRYDTSENGFKYLIEHLSSTNDDNSKVSNDLATQQWISLLATLEKGKSELISKTVSSMSTSAHAINEKNHVIDTLKVQHSDEKINSSESLDTLFQHMKKDIPIENIMLNVELYAQELRAISTDHFLNIKPSDLYNQAWTKPNYQGVASEIPLFASNLTRMVEYDILNVENDTQQINITHFYCHLLNRCLETQDYGNAFALLSALDSAPIGRLKLIKEDPLLIKTLADSKKILNPTSSFKSLRQAIIHNQDKPVLPYIGTYLTDLTFIYEGNPSLQYGFIKKDTPAMVGKVIEEEIQTRKNTLLNQSNPPQPSRFHLLERTQRIVANLSPKSLGRKETKKDLIDKEADDQLYDSSLAKSPREGIVLNKNTSITDLYESHFKNGMPLTWNVISQNKEFNEINGMNRIVIHLREQIKRDPSKDNLNKTREILLAMREQLKGKSEFNLEYLIQKELRNINLNNQNTKESKEDIVNVKQEIDTSDKIKNHLKDYFGFGEYSDEAQALLFAAKTPDRNHALASALTYSLINNIKLDVIEKDIMVFVLQQYSVEIATCPANQLTELYSKIRKENELESYLDIQYIEAFKKIAHSNILIQSLGKDLGLSKNDQLAIIKEVDKLLETPKAALLKKMSNTDRLFINSFTQKHDEIKKDAILTIAKTLLYNPLKAAKYPVPLITDALLMHLVSGHKGTIDKFKWKLIQKNPSAFSSADKKAIYAKLAAFIKENPEIAKAHRQFILDTFIDPIKFDTAFDLRGLYYDPPNNPNEVSALGTYNQSKQSAPFILNIPDTALALSAGPSLGEEAQYLESLVNNVVKVRHIIAIGRDDYHYGIYAQEHNQTPPRIFQEPDFTPLYRGGEIVNKVGRIITYKVQVNNEHLFINQLPLKNKGVMDLSPVELEYLEAIRKDSERSQSKVVIHCKGGTGRTGAMVGALLANEPQFKDLDFKTAFQLYEKERSQAHFGSASEMASQKQKAEEAFNFIRGHNNLLQTDFRNLNPSPRSFLSAFQKAKDNLSALEQELLHKTRDLEFYNKPNEVYSLIHWYQTNNKIALVAFAKAEIYRAKQSGGFKGLDGCGLKDNVLKIPNLNNPPEILSLDLDAIASLATLSKMNEMLFEANTIKDLELFMTPKSLDAYVNVLKVKDKQLIKSSEDTFETENKFYLDFLAASKHKIHQLNSEIDNEQDSRKEFDKLKTMLYALKETDPKYNACQVDDYKTLSSALEAFYPMLTLDKDNRNQLFIDGVALYMGSCSNLSILQKAKKVHELADAHSTVTKILTEPDSDAKKLYLDRFLQSSILVQSDPQVKISSNILEKSTNFLRSKINRNKQTFLDKYSKLVFNTSLPYDGTEPYENPNQLSQKLVQEFNLINENKEPSLELLTQLENLLDKVALIDLGILMDKDGKGDYYQFRGTFNDKNAKSFSELLNTSAQSLLIADKPAELSKLEKIKAYLDRSAPEPFKAKLLKDIQLKQLKIEAQFEESFINKLKLTAHIQKLDPSIQLLSLFDMHLLIQNKEKYEAFKRDFNDLSPDAKQVLIHFIDSQMNKSKSQHTANLVLFTQIMTDLKLSLKPLVAETQLQSGNTLALAEYVARHQAQMLYNPEQSPKHGEAASVHVQKVLDHHFVVSDSDEELSRGHTAIYRNERDGVVGLTETTVPGLYATMAPDQYDRHDPEPPPPELIDTICTLQNYDFFTLDDSVTLSKTIDLLLNKNKNASEGSRLMDLDLKKLERFKLALDVTEWSPKDWYEGLSEFIRENKEDSPSITMLAEDLIHELKKRKIDFDSQKTDFVNALKSIKPEPGKAFIDAVSSRMSLLPKEQQGFFNKKLANVDSLLSQHYGSKHVNLIHSKLGTPYVAISLAQVRGTEVKGFGPIGDTIATGPLHQQGRPGLSIHRGTTDAIEAHVIIRSDAQLDHDTTQNTKLRDTTAKLAIAGKDIDLLTQVYSMAVENRRPVVVNCTEGIDRTGLTLVALGMLDRALTDPSSLNWSPEQKAHKTLDLIDSLRQSRGPDFLRSERDIARGVALGETLISTHILFEFEKTLDPTLKESITNRTVHSVTETLQTIDAALKNSTENRSTLQQWKKLLEKRQETEKAFQETNLLQGAFSKKLNVEPLSEHSKLISIEEATPSELLKLLQEGYFFDHLHSSEKNILQIALSNSREPKDLVDFMAIAKALPGGITAVSELLGDELLNYYGVFTLNSFSELEKLASEAQKENNREYMIKRAYLEIANNEKTFVSDFKELSSAKVLNSLKIAYKRLKSTENYTPLKDVEALLDRYKDLAEKSGSLLKDFESANTKNWSKKLMDLQEAHEACIRAYLKAGADDLRLPAEFTSAFSQEMRISFSSYIIMHPQRLGRYPISAEAIKDNLEKMIALYESRLQSNSLLNNYAISGKIEPLKEQVKGCDQFIETSKELLSTQAHLAAQSNKEQLIFLRDQYIQKRHPKDLAQLLLIYHNEMHKLKRGVIPEIAGMSKTIEFFIHDLNDEDKLSFAKEVSKNTLIFRNYYDLISSNTSKETQKLLKLLKLDVNFGAVSKPDREALIASFSENLKSKVLSDFKRYNRLHLKDRFFKFFKPKTKTTSHFHHHTASSSATQKLPEAPHTPMQLRTESMTQPETTSQPKPAWKRATPVLVEPIATQSKSSDKTTVHLTCSSTETHPLTRKSLEELSQSLKATVKNPSYDQERVVEATLQFENKDTPPVRIHQKKVEKNDLTQHETRFTFSTVNLNKAQIEQGIEKLTLLAEQFYKETKSKTVEIIAPNESLAIQLYAAAIKANLQPSFSEKSTFSAQDQENIRKEALKYNQHTTQRPANG